MIPEFLATDDTDDEFITYTGEEKEEESCTTTDKSSTTTTIDQSIGEDEVQDHTTREEEV